jgi:hypothetical protein
MNNKIMYAFMAGVLLSGWGAFPAYARGEMHATSGEERTFHANVVVPALKTVKQAMPPTPPGWIVETESTIDPQLPEQISTEPGSLQCTYQITYKRATDVLTETWRLDKAYEESRRRNSDAANVQLEKLKKKRAETAKSLDQARKNKSGTKEKQLINALSEIDRKIGALPLETEQAILKDTEKFLVKDSKLVVRVSLNESFSEFPSGKGFTRPKAAFALRREGQRDGPKGWKESQTLIMYGDWQEARKNTFVARMKDIPYWHKVQTIAISIIGDRTRTDGLLSTMDIKAILGLMK